MSNPTAAWAQVRWHITMLTSEQLAYFTSTERQVREGLTAWCTVQKLTLYGVRVFELAARGWWR